MFGALNRFIARLDSEPTREAGGSQGSGDSSYGFQVLRNANPNLPIEPWFDFIIGINGRFLENADPSLFATEVHNCAGSSMSLDVWSAKGSRAHKLTVSVPEPPNSLGLSLQLAPLNSTQNIWHILTIPSPLSPAHQAGLLPHSDYILGSPSGTLRGESALGELVEDHLNRSLILWVYNSEFDVVREVELVPRRGWGGEGALGAVLGFGALHRLPVGLGEEVQAPGEKLFDASHDEKKSSEYHDRSNGGETGHFIVPAEMAAVPQSFAPAPPMMNPNVPPPPMMSLKASPSSNPTPAAASRMGRKARHAGVASPNRGFDDIFQEGVTKSKEQDYVPAKKGTALPPPPKIGEPAPSSVVQRSQSPEKGLEDLGEPGEAEVEEP